MVDVEELEFKEIMVLKDQNAWLFWDPSSIELRVT
jgi:hypothetical protein